MRAVIIADNSGWALHLHLSGGLTCCKLKQAGESEKLRRLWITDAPYDDGASKRGGLYFKPGKDAYISSNPKALHKCFWIFIGKIHNEIQ